MKYDLHIHTQYCGHAEGMTIEKILRQADKVGLDVICITDHIFSPAEFHVPAKIRQEVSRYENRCKVLVGAEIDVSGPDTDGRLVSEVPERLDLS